MFDQVWPWNFIASRNIWSQFDLIYRLIDRIPIEETAVDGYTAVGSSSEIFGNYSVPASMDKYWLMQLPTSEMLMHLTVSKYVEHITRPAFIKRKLFWLSEISSLQRQVSLLRPSGLRCTLSSLSFSPSLLCSASISNFTFPTLPHSVLLSRWCPTTDFQFLTLEILMHLIVMVIISSI